MNRIVLILTVCMVAWSAKFAWNKTYDPPGTHRPCVFCDPYDKYDPFAGR